MKKLLMGVVLMGTAMGVQASVTKYVCEQYRVEQFDGVITKHDFINYANIYDNGSAFANANGVRSPAMKNGEGKFEGYLFFYREKDNYAITDAQTGGGATYENCKVVK